MILSSGQKSLSRLVSRTMRPPKSSSRSRGSVGIVRTRAGLLLEATFSEVTGALSGADLDDRPCRVRAFARDVFGGRVFFAVRFPTALDFFLAAGRGFAWGFIVP